MFYARVIDGLVVEVVELPDEFTLAGIYVPDIADQFVEAGPDVGQGWTFDGDIFAAPVVSVMSLDDAKSGKIAQLTSACAAAIVGGYVSSALGAPHTYPSGMTDQINMMGSVTASLLPALAEDWSTPFWCANASGDWAFRLHDAGQIQQAGSDGKAHVVICQGTLEELSATVSAAATNAVIDAVVWPAP